MPPWQLQLGACATEAARGLPKFQCERTSRIRPDRPDAIFGLGRGLGLFGRLGDLPFPAQMMAFDFETYLPEDCLTKVDRMSMAHSIESRVPLLDHQVVEFAASLPVSMKIEAGRRKHLLKQLAFECGTHQVNGSHPTGAQSAQSAARTERAIR